MCVHVKKWREDAQPEWPEIAAGSGGGSSAGGSRGDTQAFPATGVVGVPGVPGQGHRSRSEARETEIHHGGRRASSDADETAVLPSVGRTDGWSAFDRPPTRGNEGGFPGPGETRTHSAHNASAGTAAAGHARVVRDPWSEPEEPEASVRPGATHDPHEVTVQLDGIGIQLDGMLRAAKEAPGGGESSDGPVFVDESGRRSRRFRRIGMAVALACAVYAVVIVATVLSGNSDAPWLPVEGPKEQPAGQVDIPPLPAESAPVPSGTAGVSPGASPSADAGTTASPGAGATAPGASASAEDPGASADPKPSATKPTTKPDTDPTQDPDPTVEPTVPDPDPTPTDGGGPTEEPTDTPTIDEPGTGTVADGPSDPSPIAQEPGDTASTPAAPSPEYTL